MFRIFPSESCGENKETSERGDREEWVPMEAVLLERM